MKLEKMNDFFNKRLKEYESHQLNNIEFAVEFYKQTACELPNVPYAKILDLGCGTGLELDEYFKINKTAIVTGIDLSSDMLEVLRKKHIDKNLNLINGSYFDIDLGKNIYDASVSVESFHHFTFTEKVYLYRKILLSLKDDGYLIITDYILDDGKEEDEEKNFTELNILKKENGIIDNEIYHFDTPLTRKHEIEALFESGFKTVECLKVYGNTTIIKAKKQKM